MASTNEFYHAPNETPPGWTIETSAEQQEQIAREFHSQRAYAHSFRLAYGMILVIAVGFAVWSVSLVIKYGKHGLKDSRQCPADKLFRLLIAKCALWSGIVTILLISFAINLQRTAPTTTVCTQCLYVADTAILIVMTVFLAKYNCVGFFFSSTSDLPRNKTGSRRS